MPSARRFAECRITSTRQRGSLPSAALGKAGTWQRPSLPSAKHSTKRDTRQTSSLPSVRHSAKNNPWQNTSGDTGGPTVILCRVLAVSTRQPCCLCRVSGLALGKEVALPSANSDTRQSIFFCFQIFSVAFIQYLEAHVPIWNFSMTFWYIFLIFYVYLNFSRKSKFELQVHEILEFSDSKNGIHVFECILRPCAGTFVKFRTSVSRNMTTNLLKKCFLII